MRGIGLKNVKGKHSRDISPYFTQYYPDIVVSLAETNLQFLAVSNRSSILTYSLINPHEDVSITSNGLVTIGPFSTGVGDINKWFSRLTSTYNSWFERTITGSSGSTLTEFTVRASDGYSYADVTSNVTIAFEPPPNHAPVWSSLTTLQVPAYGSVDVSGYVTDEDGDEIFFSLTGTVPSGYSITSSGILSVSNQSASVTIRASDGVLSATKSVSVTIAIAPNPAVFIIPASTSTRSFDGTVLADWTSLPTNPGRLPRAGDVIELASGDHGRFTFVSITGTALSPITIRPSTNGRVTVRASSVMTTGFVWILDDCHHFILDGYRSADPNGCGIRIMYARDAAIDNRDSPTTFLKFSRLSDNCTIRYIEIDGGWTNSSTTSVAVLGLGMTSNYEREGYLRTEVANYNRWQENIVCEYMWVRRTAGSAFYMGMNYDTGAIPLRNVTYRFNRIEDVGETGLLCKSMFSGTNLIHDNTLIRCGGKTVFPAADADNRNGIAVFSGTATIYNNTVIDTGVGNGTASGRAHGIQIYMASSGSTAVPDAPASDGTVTGTFTGEPFAPFPVNVYNNLVVRAAEKGINVARPTGALGYNARIYNNTVVSCADAGIEVTAAVDGWVRNNIALDNAGGNITGSASEANNLESGTLSAVFVSPSTDNYRLLVEQTAVGTPGTDISIRDIINVYRTGIASKGAYEYASPSVSLLYYGGTSYDRVAYATDATNGWRTTDDTVSGWDFSYPTTTSPKYSGVWYFDTASPSFPTAYPGKKIVKINLRWGALPGSSYVNSALQQSENTYNLAAFDGLETLDASWDGIQLDLRGNVISAPDASNVTAPPWLTGRNIPERGTDPRYYDMSHTGFYTPYRRLIDEVAKYVPSGAAINEKVPVHPRLFGYVIHGMSGSFGEEADYYGATPANLLATIEYIKNKFVAEAGAAAAERLVWVGEGRPYRDFNKAVVETLGVADRGGLIERFLRQMYTPALTDEDFSGTTIPGAATRSGTTFAPYYAGGNPVANNYYLLTDETYPPVGNVRYTFDELEEFKVTTITNTDKDWGYNLDTWQQIYRMGMIRSLQMRRSALALEPQNTSLMGSAGHSSAKPGSAVNGAEGLINPALVKWASLQFNRRVYNAAEDASFEANEAFCMLCMMRSRSLNPTTVTQSNASLHNLERWLTQRDADGAATTTDIARDLDYNPWGTPAQLSVYPGSNVMDMARRGTNIAFRLDNRMRFGTSIAVKVTFWEAVGNTEVWTLRYTNSSGGTTDKTHTNGATGSVQTRTFFLTNFSNTDAVNFRILSNGSTPFMFIRILKV